MKKQEIVSLVEYAALCKCTITAIYQWRAKGIIVPEPGEPYGYSGSVINLKKFPVRKPAKRGRKTFSEAISK